MVRGTWTGQVKPQDAACESHEHSERLSQSTSSPPSVQADTQCWIEQSLPGGGASQVLQEKWLQVGWESGRAHAGFNGESCLCASVVVRPRCWFDILAHVF